MTEVQKLQSERRIYQDLLILKELPYWRKKIQELGDVAIAELLKMSYDAEVRAQVAERELKKLEQNFELDSFEVEFLSRSEIKLTDKVGGTMTFRYEDEKVVCE
ncbi:hypothetical protein [Fonticella tunisiensis]|uniref:Uncharacterized protein n=1 Tax=Fonticella tunisiensis TaxID=1096341 RepID=A0A4R7KV70_9CLOT|nr:hypothetical protein [Fonticella tunisiensis]TDT63391.1 hypothetical protein EDD71_102153 [Fonticella tunisiensis]